ncbi:MAG: hypothetical protein PGN08_12155, partial [Sphingomonas taxi]
KLRDDEGGATAALTDERMLTLDQMLALAKGRVMLNLDVKANIYAEVAAAVLRAGMEKQIVIKTEVGMDTPAMAAQPPFDRLLYMPIPLNPDRKADLAAITARQMTGATPVGVELPRMDAGQLAPIVGGRQGASRPAVGQYAVGRVHRRLWRRRTGAARSRCRLGPAVPRWRDDPPDRRTRSADPLSRDAALSQILCHRSIMIGR